MELVQGISIIVIAATFAMWVNDRFSFAEFVIDENDTSTSGSAH